MTVQSQIIPIPEVARLIYSFRDQRVILDADLATLYGVRTKVLNQAVKKGSVAVRHAAYRAGLELEPTMAERAFIVRRIGELNPARTDSGSVGWPDDHQPDRGS